MRTKLTLSAILVSTLVLVGCGSKLPPNSPSAGSMLSPIVGNDAPKQTNVSPAEATAAKKAVEESPEEAEVRKLAEVIKAREVKDQAKREVVKNDTPEMREARVELQRQADNARKREKAEADVLAKAHMRGCTAGTVFVNRQAVDFNRFRDSVTVLVTNASSTSRDIRTAFRDLGTVVGNLCPGGSVTIGFTRHDFFDPNYLNITLTAIGETSQGIATQDFFLPLSYGGFNGGNNTQSLTWTIR